MARRRGIAWPRSRPAAMRQPVFAFLRRSRRRQRAFKAGILAATALAVAAIVATSPTGRYGVLAAWNRIRWGAGGLVGLKPPRAELEEEEHRRRLVGIDRTRAALARAAAAEGPRMERLLRVARMDPDSAVIRWGNFDATLVLSSDIFEPDDHGRSYRLRPHVRSIWAIGISLNGAICQFLVRDSPEARDACAAAGARIVPGSVQMTNSWGCRGPEPDPKAPLRGIVLGDSVMQGVLVGDDQSPPACLERELAERTGARVSVLNAAVLGYSPEQYYFTLRQFVDRMSPHFVVVSLCGNDFGQAHLAAGVEESCYWLGQLTQCCQTRQIPYLIVPAPAEEALLGTRDDAGFPGEVSHLLKFGGTRYFYPIEAFTDEDMRLREELRRNGRPVNLSPLYNRHLLDDRHFSPQGCALWGRLVAERLCLSLAWQERLPTSDTQGARRPPATPR
jgi:lysophospholipase L1-like esterase